MKIVSIFTGEPCSKITAHTKLQMLNRNDCAGNMEGLGSHTEFSRKLLTQLGGCYVSWSSSRRNVVPLTQGKLLFSN